MKVAATFLLGVTIFTSVLLESSTTAIKSSSTLTIDSDQIPAVKGYIIKTFQNSNALLADTITIVEVALNKVTSDKKEMMTELVNWLKYLQSLSAEAESTNLESLDKGTVEAIEDAIEVFSKAISDTGAQLDVYVKQLAANPDEVIDCARTAVKSSLDLILIRAAANLDTMKALPIVQG